MKRYALVRYRDRAIVHKTDVLNLDDLHYIRAFNDHMDEYADSKKLQEAYKKYYKID